MAKKRKAVRKRTLRANPAAPSVPAGKFIPCRGVVLGKNGVVKKMLVEDRNLGKVMRRKAR